MYRTAAENNKGAASLAGKPHRNYRTIQDGINSLLLSSPRYLQNHLRPTV